MKKKAPTEYATSMEALMPLFREQLANGKTIRFAPRGVSMLPMLRQGLDSVVLAPVAGKLKKYDLPLYRRPDGQYVLHRVVQAGRTYTCMGDNQFDPEPGVEHSWVIAVVTGFYRRDRLWNTGNLFYRLYCRLWHYSRPLRRFWRRGIHWLRRHLP